MIALGIWQLGRADEKAALIANYEDKAALTEIVEIEEGSDDLVYRTVRLACPEPRGWSAVAGRNARGQSGYAHRFICFYSPGFGFDGHTPPFFTYADIGWSTSPAQPKFEGGLVEGVLVGAGGNKYRVVANAPFAGLQTLAKPDPNDLPNNHLAYAGQWFFFALTALVIYWLALRRRRNGESGD